eukprot:m.238791 g.238791  ORF g.238791 m.238791 type:complete len:335 (+) comp22030_c0_seq1:68-1072(+)
MERAFQRTHRFIILIVSLIVGIYIGASFCNSGYERVGTQQQLQPNPPAAVGGGVFDEEALQRKSGLNESDCVQKPLESGKHRLAVIVPYRDGCTAESQGGGRAKNLEEFVPYMIQFLKKQHIDFEIFVVEQVHKGLFNKGFLFNAGFLLAEKNFDYVALHDVDQLPEVDENSYGYPEGNVPWHLCVATSGNQYKPASNNMVGGVLLMKREHFQAINGFSNSYWSWGQEDDDVFNRIRGILGGVKRPSAALGRYRSLDHPRVEGLQDSPRVRKQRAELLALITASTQGRTPTEALVMKNGYRQVKHTIVRADCEPHYTHVVVDFLNPDQPMEKCE